jgi:2-keto-4-pentenoate hydratase/2-oxohepta-3-ene-1,7-dioic acid hydratase in catechol pathway
MRYGALSYEGITYPYVLRDGQPALLRRYAGHDVAALIGLGSDELSEAVAAAEPVTGGEQLAMPPIRPGKIVAIGLNDMDHVRESGQKPPQVPLVFAKFPSSLAAAGETIVIDPEVTKRVDWEVELAVVIGIGGRRITVADAPAHVFGYTVANDLSARDIQFSDGQWVRAKSLDGFCPLGPEIVTADEIPDPQSLALRTVVNDEVVQNSTTAEMIFGVWELIAFCSGSFRLEPGDVILTGTPWGCGEFMTPRRNLHHGDVVSVSVERVGTLTNPIRVEGE